MRLIELPGVFPPHSDSWLLAGWIKREAVPRGGAVLDLCSGSGLLAIVAARAYRSEVVAVDASRRARFATQLNAKLNGVKVAALTGDLFEPVRRRRFDLIVSNPPYLPSPAPAPGRHRAARAWDAGPDGRVFIDRICRHAADHLRPEGVLLLVHSSVCGETQTLSELRSARLAGVVLDRRPGPLGPRLAPRRKWLEAGGLLADDGREEMLVIRATRALEPAHERVAK